MDKLSDCRQFDELLAVHDELPQEQRESLEAHLAGCGRCQEKISEYGKILTALRGNQTDPHPEPELLSRYAVERCDPGEVDYDGRELTPDQLTNIDSHLGVCDACREYAHRAIGEYREIDAYLEGRGLPEVLPREARTSVIERVTSFWHGLSSYGTLTYVSGVALAILVLWVSPLLRPDAERYYVLGSVSEADTEGAVVVTRADAGELNEGLTAFSGGRYREAIEPLLTYVRQNPESPDGAYARFVLGLSYLSVARSDFLGRAHRVDRDLVGRAIEQLETAAQTSESVRIREDALWFLAKGHLLQLDSRAAVEILQRIERNNGRRASDARALAAEIHALADASP